MSDPKDPSLPLIERAFLALNGFIWIGNNIHMATHDPETFGPIHEQAMADGRVVAKAIEKVLEQEDGSRDGSQDRSPRG